MPTIQGKSLTRLSISIRRRIITFIAILRRRSQISVGSGLVSRIYPHQLAQLYPFDIQIRYLRSYKLNLSTQSYIEYVLFLNGIYEKHTTNILRKYLKEGDNALDVGANIGCHTLLMSQIVGITGRVLAVEPMPRIREKLEKNLDMNAVENVTIITEAVSDQNGEASLFQPSAVLSGTNEGMSILVIGRPSGDSYLDVQMRTIDTLIAAHQLEHLAIIKIDIEGNEPLALRGAEDTLRLLRPIIIFEFSEGWEKFARADFTSIRDYLVQLGYQLYQNDRLVSGPDAVVYWGNILAIPHIDQKRDNRSVPSEAQ